MFSAINNLLSKKTNSDTPRNHFYYGIGDPRNLFLDYLLRKDIENKVWFEIKKNPSGDYYVKNDRGHHPLKVNDQDIPSQTWVPVQLTDMLKVAKRKLSIATLMAQIAKPSLREQPEYLEMKQGKTADCYLISAMNALLHLNPDKLSKLVSEDQDGNYQIVVSNQSISVKRKDLIKQSNHPSRSVRTKNELILVLEQAYAQYLLQNFNEATGKVTLFDKNKKGFSFKIKKPIPPEASPLEKAYHLLNNSSYVGYVFAFLNNIPFKQVEYLKLLNSPDERLNEQKLTAAKLNNSFQNKENVIFINIVNYDQPTQLDNYNLKAHHNYQVMPIDISNQDDQKLIQEYNEKLVASNQPRLSPFNQLYKIINPYNPNQYAPDKKHSLLLSTQDLMNALQDSKIFVWQIPAKEKGTCVVN